MIHLFCTKTLRKTLYLMAALCSSACTGLYREQEASFAPDLVSGMRFEFNQPTLFGTSLPEQDIAVKVAANLAEWGYAVTAGANGNDTHRLIAEIGPVEHGATPVGFSFSAGNSDPRALDFQKSDVLSITCVLAPNKQPQRRAELVMGFMVEDYLHNAEPSPDPAKLAALLENDISTVCFNLLSELHVPTRIDENLKTTSKPSWIPEIRLEIDNDDGPEKNTANEKLPEKSDELAAPKPKTNQPARKRIIIHNQGSPVIFKFGHERK